MGLPAGYGWCLEFASVEEQRIEGLGLIMEFASQRFFAGLLPKITYRPYSELIIHELVRYKLQDLVTLNALGVSAGGLGKPLYWAAGLALVTLTLPSTDRVVAEQLEGRAHWAHVAWAPMPRYEPYVLVKDGNVRIPIINASTNPIFNAAAVWIKELSGMKKARVKISG